MTKVVIVIAVFPWTSTLGLFEKIFQIHGALLKYAGERVRLLPPIGFQRAALALLLGQNNISLANERLKIRT